MLWVRIKTQVKDHLDDRIMEWEHTFFIMAVGLVLIQPRPELGNLENEAFWALALIVIGTARLVSLVVNGMRRKVTSWLRALSAIVSSMMFILISLGYIFSGRIGVVAAFCVIAALFEWANYGRAMRDAGASYNVGRDH